ncbi:MAG: ThuA domain-containing protein [Verrucomicrobiales bacterium]
MFIKYISLLAVLVLSLQPCLQAEEFLTSEQIKTILAADGKSQADFPLPREVLFCWSKPDHPKDVHSYQRFAQLYSSKLNQIRNLNASSIEGYPTRKQWESADLVVFNLTQSDLTQEQFASMDAYLSQGGAVMVVHQGLVQRKGYEEWAKRIGLAFSWDTPPSRSKWGKGELEIRLNTKHDIFRGFPETIRVTDELYWNLKAGNEGILSILGETTAPKKNEAPGSDADTTKWPVFWTVEHPVQRDRGRPGRVFCCVISHPDDVAFSSSFEIVMMRAFAWCLGESAGPLLRGIHQSEQERAGQSAAGSKVEAGG